MKKLIMLFVAIVFATTAAFAQEKSPVQHKKRTPAERADSCANRMERNLGLNADQKNRVRSLALTHAEKMDELRGKYKGNDAEKDTWRSERKKANEEFKEGLKLTLSAEQYAKWEEQKKARAHHKHHGKGRHPDGKCSKPDSTKQNDSVPAPGK